MPLNDGFTFKILKTRSLS